MMPTYCDILIITLLIANIFLSIAVDRRSRKRVAIYDALNKSISALNLKIGGGMFRIARTELVDPNITITG